MNTHAFFFIQNKLYWHIYRFLRSPTVRANLPKISLFWPSLILQLCLLEFQQHPQRGVLLTSFPNWGRKNSLSKINLQIQVEMKFCLGQKLTNTCRFVSGGIIVQQQKNLENIMHLHYLHKCVSKSDQFIHYKITQLLFFSLWYEFFVHYALRIEKFYQHDFDARPSEFQFLRPSGILTNPLRNLSLCFGAIGKTPGPTSCSNFV